jgi:hypothetical protein
MFLRKSKDIRNLEKDIEDLRSRVSTLENETRYYEYGTIFNPKLKVTPLIDVVSMLLSRFNLKISHIPSTSSRTELVEDK